jgi:hypothetical protein
MTPLGGVLFAAWKGIGNIDQQMYWATLQPGSPLETAWIIPPENRILAVDNGTQPARSSHGPTLAFDTQSDLLFAG